VRGAQRAGWTARTRRQEAACRFVAPASLGPDPAVVVDILNMVKEQYGIISDVCLEDGLLLNLAWRSQVYMYIKNL
jgi:hypothetical protein